MNTSKLKTHALCNAIVMGVGFFIAGCDNAIASSVSNPTIVTTESTAEIAVEVKTDIASADVVTTEKALTEQPTNSSLQDQSSESQTSATSATPNSVTVTTESTTEIAPAGTEATEKALTEQPATSSPQDQSNVTQTPSEPVISSSTSVTTESTTIEGKTDTAGEEVGNTSETGVTKGTLIDESAIAALRERSDFIKDVVNNFITNYNLTESVVTLSLVSFTLNENTQQISMVLQVSLFDLNNEQPVKVNVSYLIKPEQSIQNNEPVFASFASQDIFYISNQNDASEKLIKQFFDTSGVLNNGYIMASGDIVNDLASRYSLDYFDSDANGNYFSSVNVAPFNYHATTRNKMNLIDVAYRLPEGGFQGDGIQVVAQNIDIQLLNHAFNENYNYTGQDTYKADTVEINYYGNNIVLNNMLINTQTETSDKGLTNQNISATLSGVFPNATGDNVDFSTNASLKIDNFDWKAAERWNSYLENASSEREVANKQSIQYMLDVFKNGFTIAMTDSHVMLNSVDGLINFSLHVAPMSVSSNAKPNAVLAQLFNNLTIEMDSQIPVEWLSILGMEQDKDYLDKMVNQSIQQINMLGYNGALTYDGKIITAKFEVKKGNVFIDGKLKGSLLSSLAKFM